MRRLQREDGWVLATSITLLAIMMAVSLATFAFVDTGQKQSRQQRERESSLNLAEGVLFAQGFTLAQGWPGTATAPIAASCTQGTGATPGCPNPALLASAQGGSTANFNTVDQRSGVTWVTRVRDNGGPLSAAFVTASSDATQTGTIKVRGVDTAYTCPGPCRWDANGDRQMWVQSRAVVRNRPRNLVALLKLESLREAVPEAAVTAGGVNVSNNGNKTMIYGTGSQVVVRCDPSASSCADWDASPPPAQIVPAPVQGNPPNFMTRQQLARFKARAIADGRYYAGCPGDDNLWGAVVWIESCYRASYTSSTPTQPCSPAPPDIDHGGGNALDRDCVNQLAKPGILIAHCGALDFGGGWTFVGVVYAANNSDGTCATAGQRGGNCNVNSNHDNNLISLNGGAGVWGALAIDGPGCLHAGSNAVQIQFDPNVFNAATSYGTVGLVQNTWRELPPN